MSVQTTPVTIPNVTLTIDQLLMAIRQLDESGRTKVAQVLLKAQMDAKLAQLIEQLAQARPVYEISDANINDEIQDNDYKS